MIRVSIQPQLDAARNALNGLKLELQHRAIVSAVNRTADQSKTAAVRDITKTFNIKAADARERIVIRRASRKALEISAELRGTKKRSMNLIHFVDKFVRVSDIKRRSKAGQLQYLHAKVRRDRGSRPVMGKYGYGAFIGNKGRTVFERIGEDRLPIRAVTTVDIPQLMISEIGARNFRATVARVFGPNLANEIRRLTAGYGLKP